MARTMARIVGPQAAPASGTVIYTSPANTRTTIQYIHIINTHSTIPGSFALTLGASMTSALALYQAQSGANRISPGYGVWTKWLQITLEPGETLRMAGDTSLTVTINGYTETL